MIATTPTSTFVPTLMAKQRAFFATGKTKDLDFRKQQLQKLLDAMEKYESALLEALYKDLHKHQIDGYGTEVGLSVAEIRFMLNNVKKLAKPKSVSTSSFHIYSTSKIYKDPYGEVLIISPWNYPVLLLIQPLAGAIAAGNTVVLKPSEMSVHTSAVLVQMIREIFSEEFVAILEGGVETSQALLAEKWDYIFFTGSSQVGKIVYQAAAQHLTPVTLELGGKSPCIIDSDLHLTYSVKRFIWGKFMNAGQTCVAPDYLLVDRKMKDKVLAKMKEVTKELFGEDAQQSPTFGRIINDKHFQRLERMLEPEKIIFGGKTDAKDRYISPTFMEVEDWNCPVMQEEIFGPILPILYYDKIEEAIQKINAQPKPLAMYIFSNNNNLINKVLTETSAGGGCVNDTLMHLGSHSLPFGGVGDSGIGAYHGKYSFDTFSHEKSILRKSNLFDVVIRYISPKLSLKVMRFLFRWTL
jgi:acyl-CoA reductase-like NAD-dependent aldehyde dehydrogenase